MSKDWSGGFGDAGNTESEGAMICGMTQPQKTENAEGVTANTE
jgi:hypothetical protein